MESFEPKKLALIRIWQILKDYSDFDHPLTQEDIAVKLQNEYGIILERKAISRNISLLKEAGIGMWELITWTGILKTILRRFLGSQYA